jgi:predicted O-methyltransferase YrrM
MRSFAHWTPRYLIDRSLVALYQRRHPNAPWLTATMVDVLASWLKSTDIGMEFGSGRSTLWFASRVKHLVSTEHDANWGQRVEEKIRSAGLSEKVAYWRTGPSPSADTYLAALKDTPPESLDFILVDGLFRDACAVGAVQKLRSGGILIVDNINWYLPPRVRSYSPASRSRESGCLNKVWQQFEGLVSNWRCIWTSNGVWDTALWIKPA